MLPLPPFELHKPRSVEEAVETLARLGPDAVVVAGGTDLLPNMKRGLLAPRHVVALGDVATLACVRVLPQGAVRIGASVRLDEIAAHPVVRARAAALAEAAETVGGPHHRRMGTLGGNLCLDTRCHYYNQSEYFRAALGYCLKKDGDRCHVVPAGRRCVAAASNDTAAAAIALDASIELVSARGRRTVAARDFYTADGAKNHACASDEIVVALEVPLVEGRASAYEKLRRRASIDFPLVSLAARVDVVGDEVKALEIVVSALAARPKRIARVEEMALGKRPNAVPRGAIAEATRAQCAPLPNVDADVEWRKEMVTVLAVRALRRLGVGP